ncbi:MAG: hypothetical protein RR581_06970 [Eubacterium sp.]
MNGLATQAIVNDVIEDVCNARIKVGQGKLLDPIQYGVLFGKVSLLKRLELIQLEDGKKMLHDVNFAYTGSREDAI